MVSQPASALLSSPDRSVADDEPRGAPVDLDALGASEARIAEAAATLRPVLENALAHGVVHLHLEPGGRHWRLRYRHDDGLDETLIEEHAALPEALSVLRERLASIEPRPRSATAGFSTRLAGKAQLIELRTLRGPAGDTSQLTLHGHLIAPPRLDELCAEPARLAELRTLLARDGPGWLAIGAADEPGGAALVHAIAQEFASPDRKLWCIEPPWRAPLARVTSLERSASVDTLHGIDADAVLLAASPSDDALRCLAARATETLLVVQRCTARRPSDVARRLLAIGLSPSWLALAMPAIVMRHRVRRLCPDCRTRVMSDTDEAAPIGSDEAGGATTEPCDVGGWLERSLHSRFRRGEGCGRCHGTAHEGVHDVLDVIPLDEALRRALHGGDLDAAFVRLDRGRHLAARLSVLVASGEIGDDEAQRHLARRY